MDVKRIIKRALSKLNIGAEFWRIPQYPIEKGIKLNIGSGNWEKRGWICLDYPTEHYTDMQKGHKITPYDIRSNLLPFKDESVSAIYTSNVIEHIEDVHIQKLFNEAWRVMKPGGYFA